MTVKNWKIIFIVTLLMACVGVLHWYFHGALFMRCSSVTIFNNGEHSTVSPAVLLWSEDGIITASSVTRWRIKSITKGENPRWSPDGSRFVFTRNNDVWLMDTTLLKEIRIFQDVVTEYGTGAYWGENGKSVIVIPRKKSYQVIQLDLKTGKTKVIHDERRPPFKGFHLSQCAELRFSGRYLLTFTTDSSHRSMIVDLKDKRYITNSFMQAGDCGPAWSPDGSFIVMTRRVRGSRNRPLFITHFDSRNGAVSDSKYFVGKNWCYDATVSNDSKYVAYVSEGNIYICNVKEILAGNKFSIQMTTEGKSAGPSLFVYPETLPEAFR